MENIARKVREGEHMATYRWVDAKVQSELEQAGIEIWGAEEHRFSSNGFHKEVPTKFVGKYKDWTFERAWYYWIATSRKGITFDKADAFYNLCGRELKVRAFGHCGNPLPSETKYEDSVTQYHIDTQEGLNAFVGLLDQLYMDITGKEINCGL